MNALERLETWSRRKPGATAVTVLNPEGLVAESLSFGELYRGALHLARALTTRGCEGQRLLLPAESSCAFVCALIASMMAGAVPVPVPVSTRPAAIARLRRIALDAGVHRGLSLQAGATAIAAELPELDWMNFDHDCTEEEQVNLDVSSFSDPQAPALLQYTSGSITAPKGVLVTHGNLAANLSMARESMQVDENSRILSWLPMHHDMGLVGQLLLALYSGATLTLMTPHSFIRRPEAWLQAIASQKATISGGPNFAYELAVRRAANVADDCDLSSWKVAFCGAEKVCASTLRTFAKRFSTHGFDAKSFFPCYGLAEATVFVSGGPFGRELKTTRVDGSGIEVVSCGRPASRVEVVAPDSSLAMPEGMEGEIWVAGPHVSPGYLGQAGANNFDARIEKGDGTPFMRTGDMGFLLDGELFVTGRLKDIIVHKGENLHPEDIEATILQSHPRFGPLGAAFSIEGDQEERVIALFETDRGVRPDELSGMLRSGMRAVAEVHGVRLGDLILTEPGTLARTTSGKVRRIACRTMYLDGSFDVLASFSGEMLVAAAKQSTAAQG